MKKNYLLCNNQSHRGQCFSPAILLISISSLFIILSLGIPFWCGSSEKAREAGDTGEPSVTLTEEEFIASNPSIDANGNVVTEDGAIIANAKVDEDLSLSHIFLLDMGSFP